MNTRSLKKTAGTAAVIAACAFGMGQEAVAAPEFTVDPTVIGNDAMEVLFANDTFDSDFIQGNASTLVTLGAGGAQSATGWVRLTGFEGANAATSGLDLTYTMWVEFEYTAQLVSGTFGAPLSVSDITSLSFEVWAAPNTDTGASTTTFTFADASGGGTAPDVIAGAGAQQIGFGELLDGTAGAVVNGQGGTGFNSDTTYQNTAFGNTFFIQPVPFYNVSFNEFNNTEQGVEVIGNLLAINNASGGLDFNRVPEPGTLLLLGSGLLGIGWTTRKRATS